MTRHGARPLDTDAPEVERAMAMALRLPQAQRDEFVRTVYRYVFAYRGTRDTGLLTELANGVLASAALRTDPAYLRAIDELRAASDAAGRPAHPAEPERRAG